MRDFSLGKIYKVVNSVNDKIYIGSTSQPLCERMKGHRRTARLGATQALYCSMRQLGIELFKIVLIENYSCQDVSQLVARENMIMLDAKARGIQLFNHTIGGRVSIETRQRMRIAHIGKVASFEARKNMSKARFKRGSVQHDMAQNRWTFRWKDNGKTISKTFAVKKYGDAAAHGLALYWQEERYPLERDDDSELIREIRSRNEA